MTTYTPFVPTPSAPFQFTPTLDGVQYTAIIKWNISGQRWYLFLYTLQQQLVMSIAMIGSPDGINISLTKGFFTSTLVYRTSTNQFEVSP